MKRATYKFQEGRDEYKKEDTSIFFHFTIQNKEERQY